MSHYTVNRLDGWPHLRQLFKHGADSMNWLFLSTSGFHGSYATLDDIHIAGPEDVVTVLVVNPRMVRTFYGLVDVETDEQEAWLRARVAETLSAVAASQDGNLPTTTDEGE